MATLEEALEAVQEEWDYQDQLQAVGKIGLAYEDHDVSRYILMLEHYAQLARTKWNDFEGDEAALDQIRKIAALGLRCMVTRGVVRRTDTSRLTRP